MNDVIAISGEEIIGAVAMNGGFGGENALLEEVRVFPKNAFLFVMKLIVLLSRGYEREERRRHKYGLLRL